MSMNSELNVLADNALSKLLDIYQAQNRDYTWKEFLDCFSTIINKQIEEWKKEEIEYK